MVTALAATVVALRDGDAGLEVLLLRRNDRGMFGDMWVFPGGQVDPADMAEAGVAEDADDGPEDAELAAARRAATREAWEEARLRLESRSLLVHSWWMPPPATPRRFSTWFFLAAAPPDADIRVDGVEIVDHRWMAPGDALAARDRHELRLAPPTWMTLWWLCRYRTVAESLEAAAACVPERFETNMVRAGEELVALWEGDAGYQSSDPGAAGPRRRLWLAEAGWWAEVST